MVKSTIEENKLVVGTDEKYNDNRDPDYERRRQNNQKSLVTTLLELILINQILMNMKNLVGYKSTLKNQLKNH